MHSGNSSGISNSAELTLFLGNLSVLCAFNWLHETHSVTEGNLLYPVTTGFGVNYV